MDNARGYEQPLAALAMTEQQQTNPKADKGTDEDDKGPSESLDEIRIAHEAGSPARRSVLKVSDAEENEITEAALEDLGVSIQLESGKKLAKITMICNAGHNSASTFNLEFKIVPKARHAIVLGSDAIDELLAKRRGAEVFLGIVKRLRKGGSTI